MIGEELGLRLLGSARGNSIEAADAIKLESRRRGRTLDDNGGHSLESGVRSLGSEIGGRWQEALWLARKSFRIAGFRRRTVD